MPELPEIETIRRTLEPRLLGHTITRAALLRPDVLQGSRAPRALLAGLTITAITRHGKQLALLTTEGPCLNLHMGMSGRLDWADRPCATPRPPHTHALWATTAGELRFIDPRRFGGLWTFPSPQQLRTARWDALGPDAASLTTAQLSRACANRRAPIKAVLLDQRALAGVGNIYADEALFAARIHPLTPADHLQHLAIKSLAATIRAVLSAAIRASGSTLRDYRTPDGSEGGYRRSHAVYGRQGQPCRRCQRPLEGAKVAGRSTVLCPSCQQATTPPLSR